MAVDQPETVRRTPLRSRRSYWFAGVCGGLGGYLGVAPGLLRLALLLLGLFGGAGLAVYLVAWIVMPLEPEADARSGARTVAGLRGITAGVGLGGAACALYLLASDRSTMALGWGIVVAPAVIAIGAAAVRSGRGRARIATALVGLGMTALLALLNYSPTVGDRTEQPASPLELIGGYTNIFGTMTIDLTALNIDEGKLRVQATSVFGDVVVRVPAGTEVRGDGGTVSTAADLVVDLDVSSLFGSVDVVDDQP